MCSKKSKVDLSHNSIWRLIVLLTTLAAQSSLGARNRDHGHVDQCMSKIIEFVQPCSQQAVNDWNLNHSRFVPSRMSTCCANWQVYECFMQASLVNCSLLEFQAMVHNMTYDALSLQRNECSRYKYHSDSCDQYGGGGTLCLESSTFVIVVSATLALSLLFISNF